LAVTITCVVLVLKLLSASELDSTIFSH